MHVMNLMKGNIVLALGLFLTACGGGADEHPVPPNSTMTLTPTDVNWEISPAQEPEDPNDPDSPFKPCVETDAYLNQTIYNDHTFSATLVDSEQRALGLVDLQIVVDLSGTTFSSPNVTVPPIRVYDDKNGNGVADDPEELVSGANGGGFFTKTGEYSGTKNFIVRVNLACAYRATVYAYADLVSTQSVIEIVEEPTN